MKPLGVWISFLCYLLSYSLVAASDNVDGLNQTQIILIGSIVGGGGGLLVLLVCCCVGLYACKKCCFSKSSRAQISAQTSSEKSPQPTAPPLGKTGHWDQQPPSNPHFNSPQLNAPESPPAYTEHVQPTNRKRTKQNSDSRRRSSVRPEPTLPGSIETDYDTNTDTNVSAQDGGISLSNKTNAKHSMSIAGASRTSGGVESKKENKNETSVTTESGIKIATQTSTSSSFKITS